MLNSVNGGQGLVVNVLWSVATVQNYPDTGAYCYTAREKMRWLLRWLLRWYALINVATGTHLRFI